MSHYRAETKKKKLFNEDSIAKYWLKNLKSKHSIRVKLLISSIYSKVKLNFILQIQLIVHCCYAAIDETRYSGKGIKVVSIDDNDKTQYDERGLDQSTSKYEVDIDKNAQFNHQSRGPDGIIYGCYGYLDSDGKLQSKYYIADARGFRLLSPADLVEVFPVATKSK